MPQISYMLKQRRLRSFEIFPPKREFPVETVYPVIDQLAGLRPDFVSVTYGAGGSTARSTPEVAGYVERHLPALAHLTCIEATPEGIDATISELAARGIQNVLALRGDLPEGMERPPHYHFAADLVAELRRRPEPLCIGVACYPEGHPESGNVEAGLPHLKAKLDAGADFMVSQLFFDNTAFYHFCEKLQQHGVTAPLLAGIMPVTDARQIQRIIRLSGASVPQELSSLLSKYADSPEEMRAAGIAFAQKQIDGLDGLPVSGVHVYAMNKPDVVAQIHF